MAKKKQDALATGTTLEEKVAGTTSLARTDTKTIGAAMVEAGVKAIQRDQEAHLTIFTRTSMEAIARFKQEIRQREGWIAFQEARLKAIHDGAFDLNENMHPVFHDRALNEPGRGDWQPA